MKDENKYPNYDMFLAKIKTLWADAGEQGVHDDVLLQLENIVNGVQRKVIESYENRDYEGVLHHAQTALELRKIILAPDHLDFYASYVNIGGAYSELEKFDEALYWYKLAFDVYENNYPADHPDMAKAHNNLAETYLDLDKYKECLYHSKAILEINEKHYPPDSSEVVDWQKMIGDFYTMAGQPDESILYYKKVLEAYKKALPSNHPDISDLRMKLAGVCKHLKRWGDFISLLEEEKELRVPNDPELIFLLAHIGEAYMTQEDIKEAVVYYTDALNLAGTFAGSIEHVLNVNIAFIHDGLAMSLEKTENNKEEVLRHKLIALKIKEKLLAPWHPSIVATHGKLASAYIEVSKFEQAVGHQKKLSSLQKRL